MTETDTTPGSYSIEVLLSQTVQPFPDLPPDEFEVLKESIRTRGLLNPVLLTSDGYLFDGHQRCKALVALGKKRIRAENVKIMPKVTRENMIGNAYASNLVRRMQTSADKAARMHQCAAMGWSQRRIAKEFSMSQPGVSQLMEAYPPEDGAPEVIITQGEDGKTYTREPRGARPRPEAWAPSGVASKAIRQAIKMLAKKELSLGKLDEWEKGQLMGELEDLRVAIDEFTERMESI
jgi:ParB-like chromosome segregation protein Spo0J